MQLLFSCILILLSCIVKVNKKCAQKHYIRFLKRLHFTQFYLRSFTIYAKFMKIIFTYNNAQSGFGVFRGSFLCSDFFGFSASRACARVFYASIFFYFLTLSHTLSGSGCKAQSVGATLVHEILTILFQHSFFMFCISLHFCLARVRARI